MKKILTIKNLRKIYHTKNAEILAVDDFSFDLYEGEFVSIVGPSGCGKSTVLSILSGLLDKSEGQIKYNDNIKFGYMLQNDSLFPFRNIVDNCMIGLEISKEKTVENEKYVIDLLNTYGLKEFIHSFPENLSGGMRQRCALIRTLACKPDVLLLDEPFSALDYQTRISVSNDVCNIIKNEKKTLIIVTHDISEAISMCNKIIVMSKRPSTIKKTYNIDYDFDRTNPIKSRSSKEFMEYYEKIWEDLNDEK